MSKKEIRIECMSEILDSVGLSATQEQIETIVDDFALHLEMEDEMDSYAHRPAHNTHQTINELERKVQSLKYELEAITKERNVYHDSVKQRRNASRVWVQDNDVRYE